MFATLAPILLQATLETFAMVISALALGTAFGLPLGVLLATSGRGELFEAPLFQKSIGPIVNATRSVPFIILAVAIIPFTRLIVGTSIGTSAAIVPLTVAAIPFIARIIEGAIREVDGGLVEAAQAMGARPFQVVTKVLLPEALAGHHSRPDLNRGNPDRVFGDGWRGGCRWPWRSWHSLWLSAFPPRCDGGGCHHPDCGGADGAKPWRLDGAQGGQAQYLNPFSFLYLL